jgi:hypothetical protein
MCVAIFNLQKRLFFNFMKKFKMATKLKMVVKTFSFSMSEKKIRHIDFFSPKSQANGRTCKNMTTLNYKSIFYALTSRIRNHNLWVVLSQMASNWLIFLDIQKLFCFIYLFKLKIIFLILTIIFSTLIIKYFDKFWGIYQDFVFLLQGGRI